MYGAGFTSMVTVNVGPVQVPVLGVTVYTTLCDMLVVFTNVCVIDVCPVGWLLSPVTFVLSAKVHVYVVFTGNITVGGLLAGMLTVNNEPLHTEAVIFTIFGLGSTLTANVNGLPTHDPAAPDVGVMVYKTDC